MGKLQIIKLSVLIVDLNFNEGLSCGGVNGNLKPFFDVTMKTFMVETNGRLEMLGTDIWGENMKVYLAGTYAGNQSRAVQNLKIEPPLPPILESFYYADQTTEALIPLMDDFLLDSGAFTFMNGQSSDGIIWEEYVHKYADFINRNKIEKFLELDIDSVVGYPEVKRLRKILITKTNRLPIPVWHRERGRNDFLEMCNEFPYVAVGGIVTKEIKRSEYGIFKFLIDEAHKSGAKIHGLGLTNFDALKRYHFDSVDSSSWTSGNRFGFVCKFNGSRILNIHPPAGAKIRDPRVLAVNNFKEWTKFSKYAEENL